MDKYCPFCLKYYGVRYVYKKTIFTSLWCKYDFRTI